MSEAAPEGRRPRAFRLDQADEGAQAGAAIRHASGAIVESAADAFLTDDAVAEAEAPVAAPAGRARWRLPLSWAGLFWSALAGLVSLSLSLWAWRLVGDLFAAAPALGWLGAALGALALAALLALAIREARALLRLSKISHLSAALAGAYANDDSTRARPLLTEVIKLYAARPGMARGRAALTRHMRDIIDGRDLVALAERELMARLDAQAQREIALAARRVSTVTAISPRAIVDLVFVLAQAVRLLRRIAEIYGGRPGVLGFFRLARSIGAHLAVTGGMAVGDSLMQQLLGHGIAAKLSARLGEGVLNGLLTARIGLAAMAVCRPVPFASVKPPGVREAAPFLFGATNARP